MSGIVLDEKKISLILVISLLLALYAGSTFGSPEQISITATQLKMANPGEIVTHVFTVTNESATSGTYKLTLDLPEGWTSLPISTEVTLSPQGSKPIFVNVNVPEDAPAGKYEITLTASSVEGSVEASETTYIQVESVPGFDLSWKRELTGPSPGTTVEGAIKIVNSGNTMDTYKVEVSLEEEWKYTVEKEEVRLFPGQSKTVIISVSPPEGASSGEKYRVEIGVTSAKRPKLERILTITGSLAPPPPEKVPDDLYPTWATTFDTSLDQSGDPSFLFSGNGDIPSVGEVSARLRFDVNGVNGASLSVMKENWGFTLDGASISGSYLGVSGSPLFIGEFESSTARLIFTEEAKGLTLEKEGDYWDIRGVLATEEEEFSFAELQGVYEFSTGQVLDGLITTAEANGEKGSIVEAGIELSGDRIDLYPSFVKVFSGYPNQLPSQGYNVDVSFEEEEFTSTFTWDYNRTKLGQAGNSYHTTENSFNATTSIDLGENLDSNFSLSWIERTSDDEPQSNYLVSREFSGSLSGGSSLGWSIGGSFARTQDHVSDTVITVESINASLDFDLGETEHTVSTSFNRTSGPIFGDLSNTLTMTSSFPEAPLSPTFSLTRGSRDTTARISISETDASDLSVNLSLSASLVQQDSISASLTASFPGLFRFAGQTKGQVTGVIFVDENGDKERDPGEKGVDNVLLRLNNEKAISASRGKFAFPPVSPGEYNVKIEEIESGLKTAVDMPITVKVNEGEKPKVKIPVRPRSWIRGLVFNDEDESGNRSQGEEGMSGVEFTIEGQGVQKEIRSGPNGRFTIDVPPGRYEVNMIKESLPERYEPTTPARVSV
ncbi:MAG: NEW3 domain-containing protein, partial [Candidatus Bipolaricaulota bacterium]